MCRRVTANRIQPFTRASYRLIRENAWTNSTSDMGCNYVNSRTSAVHLITADPVLYIALREIIRLVLSVFEMI